MVRLILIFLLTFFSKFVGFSQSISDLPGKYDYYFYIKGIKTKQDVRFLESEFKQKKGVTYFLCDRFPVRFCYLKSDLMITKSDLKSWLDASKGYELLYFGMGIDSKEGAIVAGMKSSQ